MLPIPPSYNDYWRPRVIKLQNPKPKQVRLNGGYAAIVYVSKVGKEYQKRVAERLAERGLSIRTRGLVELQMCVCPPSNRRMDNSNRIKVLEDTLTIAGVIEDDSQIWRHVIERGPVIKGGRVIISLREISPDEHGAVQRTGWKG